MVNIIRQVTKTEKRPVHKTRASYISAPDAMKIPEQVGRNPGDSSIRQRRPHQKGIWGRNYV